MNWSLGAQESAKNWTMRKLVWGWWCCCEVVALPTLIFFIIMGRRLAMESENGESKSHICQSSL